MSRPTVPYGEWSSPITPDLVVAASVGLGEVLLDTPMAVAIGLALGHALRSPHDDPHEEVAPDG